jgi:tetratricopeptide (TPR) repeat protein
MGTLKGQATAQKPLLDAVGAHRRGDLDAAEAGYRAILRAQPKHFDATHLLGAVLLVRGRNKEAETFLRRAVALSPGVAAAHSNLGNAVRAQGQAEASLAHYDRAIALDPGYVDALSNRGNVRLDLGWRDEALADFERALARDPTHANALQKSARILAELGRYEEALARNARALALDANSADAWVRSGNVLHHLKRPADALASYDRALALEPDHVDALSNRSAALEGLGRPEEALAGLDRVLAVQPDKVGALNNKATILKSLGRIAEAYPVYRRALALAPDDAETQSNLAMTLLLDGDYAPGWEAYEARWRKKANLGKKPALTSPAWRGEPLEGRRIVVFAEQGLGDIVQFARYLPLLQARGAAVTFLVAARMHALLRAAFPGITLATEVAQVAARDFDFQCAMMSLPLGFGTRLETVPAVVPYLKPEPERVARWRERLGPGGFRIGICWQGNPDPDIDAGRSVPLEAFAPIAAVPDVRLISLQKNAGLDQLEQVESRMAIETLGEDFDSGPDSFADTLAVMESLDLVISPDTSIAHVAGALARPAWIALKRVPDWRWMLDRADSPWYPTARLFRQTQRGDWTDVFARMRATLTAVRAF